MLPLLLRLLIGLLLAVLAQKRPSSAPPSDCLFCLRLSAPPCTDLCSTLQDYSLISSSPFLFIALSSPKTLLDGLSGLLSANRHMESAKEKLQKSLQLDTTSSPPSDFFCILELLRCLCRKDPLITFYWPVKLWPPIRVSSRPSQGLRGTLPALCWVIGNGLVGSTSFGSLCPIRSPLTPVPTSSA